MIRQEEIAKRWGASSALNDTYKVELPDAGMIRHCPGMPMPDDWSAERRWIVLSEDGRFITLGRASDPTEQEILDAQAALLRQGMAGWLAVMRGNPHVGAVPQLIEVRHLGEPTVSFEQATEACLSEIVARREQSSP